MRVHVQHSINITAALSERASKQPTREAMVLPGRRLSYAQLDELVWLAAGSFYARGVRHGQVVAIWLRDDLLIALATLGLARLGATVARLASSSTPSQLQAQFRQVSLDFIVGQDIPPGGEVATLAFAEDDLTQTGIHRPPSAPATGPVFLLFGSGSTGDVKVLPVDAAIILARCRIGEKEPLYQSEARVLMLSGLQFAVPMIRMLVLLHNGGTLILTNQQSLDVVRYCCEVEPTVIQGGAMHFERILHAIDLTQERPFKSLRAARVGTGTVSQELRERIRRHIAPAVSVSYAANECGVISELLDDGSVELAPGSVGRPIEGVEVEIVSAQGLRLGPGEIGQIRVKTPCLISGYYKDPQATQARFRDGWFDTGDLGSLTAGGELIFHGRADAMMICNGINIYPAEIENCLRLLEDVRDIHVFPFAHKVHQQVPACALTLKSGSPLTQREIERFAQKQLGFKSPQLVFIIPVIPRHATGKLNRPEFMQMVRAEMLQRITQNASAHQKVKP